MGDRLLRAWKMADSSGKEVRFQTVFGRGRDELGHYFERVSDAAPSVARQDSHRRGGGGSEPQLREVLRVVRATRLHDAVLEERGELRGHVYAFELGERDERSKSERLRFL